MNCIHICKYGTDLVNSTVLENKNKQKVLKNKNYITFRIPMLLTTVLFSLWKNYSNAFKPYWCLLGNQWVSCRSKVMLLNPLGDFLELHEELSLWKCKWGNLSSSCHNSTNLISQKKRDFENVSLLSYLWHRPPMLMHLCGTNLIKLLIYNEWMILLNEYWKRKTTCW